LIVVTVFLLLGLVLLPVGLFLTQKVVNLHALETAKDHLDLGISHIVVALETEALSEGRLKVSNQCIEDRLEAYLEEQAIALESVEVVLLPRGGSLEGEVRLKIKVMDRLLGRRSLKGETYEIVRKIEVPVDR
jgi:hypothetical protein